MHRSAAFVVVAVVPVTALALWSQVRAGRPLPLATAPAGSTMAARAPLITVSAEEMQNAGIRTEPARVRSIGAPTGLLRTTGVVAPNAYRELPIIAPAGGVVSEVKAELGDRVFHGSEVAVVESAELAQAVADYVKLLHDVDHLYPRFNRTKELYELGAESRDELQRTEAEFRNKRADLLAARRRLESLEVTPAVLTALHEPGGPDEMSRLAIRAPMTGRVVARSVNVNERISSGREVFRVADLSRVWVIAQVFERDLGAIRTGLPARVTAPAYGDRRFSGQVSYIDSRVDPETHTVQVRIETANRGEALKLGMYVDVAFVAFDGVAPPPARSIVVPASAVQTIGNRRVVYVETETVGAFEERDVVTDPERDGLVRVRDGLSEGERVVTSAAFLMRAESLKRKPTHHVH